MTKREYCIQNKIHICNPRFNPEDEVDKHFMDMIDEIIHIELEEVEDDNAGN